VVLPDDFGEGEDIGVRHRSVTVIVGGVEAPGDPCPDRLLGRNTAVVLHCSLLLRRDLASSRGTAPGIPRCALFAPLARL
jgi:hypothetical protein